MRDAQQFLTRAPLLRGHSVLPNPRRRNAPLINWEAHRPNLRPGPHLRSTSESTELEEEDAELGTAVHVEDVAPEGSGLEGAALEDAALDDV